MARLQLRFNKIWVIESLDANEARTGHSLYENHLKHLSLRRGMSNLETCYRDVVDASQFWDVMNAIFVDSSLGKWPILHLEAHGNSQGLQFASGEIISWELIAEALARINEKTQLNLIVTLAACEGASLLTQSALCQRAPFAFLLAPESKIDSIEIEEIFSNFYSRLLVEDSIVSILQRLQVEHPAINMNYALTTTRDLWHLVMMHYRKVELAPERMAERESKFIDTMRKDGRSPYRYLLANELKLIYWKGITGPVAVERFRQRKKLYFMCDLYPENYFRFDVDNLRGVA